LARRSLRPNGGLYLFGSRRYRTGSPRSDIDVLVELKPDSDVRPASSVLSVQRLPSVGFVPGRRGKAVSCENESSVRAPTFDELVTKLEAVCFWKRSGGVIESADIDWTVTVPIDVEFVPSALLTGLLSRGGGHGRSAPSRSRSSRWVCLPSPISDRLPEKSLTSWSPCFGGPWRRA